MSIIEASSNAMTTLEENSNEAARVAEIHQELRQSFPDRAIHFDEQTRSFTISPFLRDGSGESKGAKSAVVSGSSSINGLLMEDDQTTFYSTRSRFSFRSLITRSSLFSDSTGFRSYPGATWQQELVITMDSGFGPGSPRNADYRPVIEGRERGGFLPRIRGVGRTGKGPAPVPKAMIKAMESKLREMKEEEARIKAEEEAEIERQRQEEEWRQQQIARDEAEARWKEKQEAERLDDLERLAEVKMLMEKSKEETATAQEADETSELIQSYSEALTRYEKRKGFPEWFNKQVDLRERALWLDHYDHFLDISEDLKNIYRLRISPYANRVDARLHEPEAAQNWDTDPVFRQEQNMADKLYRERQVSEWSCLERFDDRRELVDRSHGPVTNLDFWRSEGGRWEEAPRDF